MTLYEELKQRGIIYQISNKEAVQKYLAQKGNSFYVGFDPTAESLHVGGLFQIITMKRLEKTGLKPIVLVGGATGMIGDPSGKSQERQLTDLKTIKHRGQLFKKQLSRFFDFKKSAVFADNYSWLGKVSLIEFLRDIGKHFTIGEMVAKESVKTRLQTGISFTEFSYMVLQAFDFFNLFKKHKCSLQLGGSDQWGNITAGIELVRKKEGQEVYGATIPLVMTADGKKMGKSEEGAVWLDAKMTSPYNFYQFWLNTDDKDVVKFLNYYTFLSLEEIKILEGIVRNTPEKREPQKVLAKEMTIFVHGENAFKQVEKVSQALFYGKIANLSKSDLEQIFHGVAVKTVEKLPLNIADFLVETTVSVSKRQAREDIQNKAIEINGVKISDLNYEINKEDLLFGKYIIVKRGKKDYHFISIK